MSPPAALDLRDPSVRLYLKLVRLQVLTPLSLLINIAASLVTAFIVHPSLGNVSQKYLTSITPNSIVVGLYWMLVFAGQIGFCLLLVIARKDETKHTLVSLGLSVVLANWVMAAWAVTWALRAFVASTVLMGLLVLLLLYANLNLLIRSSNAVTSSRPLDALFIHAPIRFFLIMPLTLLLWQSLFIAMKHSWTPTHPEYELDKYHWEGVAVVTSSGIIGLLAVALRGDIVWTIGATWTLVAVAFGPKRNAPVLATSITFIVLFPVTLVAALIHRHVQASRREGAIALPPDEEGAAPMEAEHDDEVERLRIRMDEEQHAQKGQPQRDPSLPQPQPPTAPQYRAQQSPAQVEESVWG